MCIDYYNLSRKFGQRHQVCLTDTSECNYQTISRPGGAEDINDMYDDNDDHMAIRKGLSFEKQQHSEKVGTAYTGWGPF